MNATRSIDIGHYAKTMVEWQRMICVWLITIIW